MKILVISDEESKYLSEYYHENDLENVDLILSVGDLPYSYLETIKTNIKKPLFYVKGNHDILRGYHRHKDLLPFRRYIKVVWRLAMLL